MQRPSTLALWCERIIEGGWLFALVFIPSYFNLFSSRHFEPDKATALRSIVLVMAAAALVRWLDRLGLTASTSSPAAANSETAPRESLWKRLRSTPMALPILLYIVVFLLANVVSIVPNVSFWGSYQRLQGTYTNLSYIGLAILIMLTLRTKEQFHRLIDITILGSLGAIGYGLVQHFQIDPLPWRGDVVSRVASTMGNSIFVAAYLIMVVPYALYRAITALRDAQQAPVAARPSLEIGWAAGYGLLILGAIAILFASLQIGAVALIVDLSFWWIYPGALVVATALYLLTTLSLPQTGVRGAKLIPGLLAIFFAIIVGLKMLTSTLSTNAATSGGASWPIWMIVGVVLVVAAYALFFTLPKLSGSTSRLWLRLQGGALLLITALLLLTIFFTQSRGPWLGIGAALFVFFTLVLLRAWRRAVASGAQRAALWRNLLLGEIVLAVLFGAFLITFNLSHAPIFESLRSVPYIGRMGTLLETDEGTGLVRRLIWFGDDKAGGAVALITSDPVRMIVGWGPESMFVAYNKFYPPSLANIESRGASPDRSHEAYLDELVNKGVLGLLSYLFVLGSFFWLCWWALTRVGDWHWEVFFIAAIATVVAHSVEGLTGIPIVVTLMLLWVTIGITVVAGGLAGLYRLGSLTPPQAVAEQEPEEEAVTVPSGKPRTQAARGGRRGGAVARGAQKRPTAVATRRSQSTSSLSWLIAVIVFSVAIGFAWFTNADNVYADMRFQQGQLYADSTNVDLTSQLMGMSYYLDAIQMEPGQDFYYLSLGRTLMNIVDLRRQAGVELGEPKTDARISDLKLPSLTAAQQFIASTQVAQIAPGAYPGSQPAPQFVLNMKLQEIMSYAQVVLERARDLNPENKDHYANLGRLHSFWYTRLTQDPAQLEEAIDWYRQAHESAPQDVVILNEYASSIAMLATYQQSQNDQAGATASFDKAQQLLDLSESLDSRYQDTALRIAELLRLRGQVSEATDRYIAQLQSNPHALDGQIGTIVDTLTANPDQLRRLRTAYEEAVSANPDQAVFYSYIGIISERVGDLPQAVEAFGKQVELQPDSLEAIRNYTLVLSDTQQYQQAATQAERLLALVQQQQTNADTTELQTLLKFFQAKAAAG